MFFVCMSRQNLNAAMLPVCRSTQAGGPLFFALLLWHRSPIIPAMHSHTIANRCEWKDWLHDDNVELAPVPGKP
jgi:hypothetical protein